MANRTKNTTDLYSTICCDANESLHTSSLKWSIKVEKVLGKGQHEGDVRSVSYYLTHADHTDKWLKHKPAEKTNKTLFS